MRELDPEAVKAEGGLATSSEVVDPVSGNVVPPGSVPEEVRDEVDAKLSPNEYVVPADVLRFYGVKFFEGLREKAKMKLAEMDAGGRIGGDTEEEDDDLPFSDEELMAIDDEETPQMAEGGMVPGTDPNSLPQSALTGQGMETKTYVNSAGAPMSILFMNGKPLTPIPPGYSPQQEAQAPQATGEKVTLPTAAKGSADLDKPENQTKETLGWAQGKNWKDMSPEEATQLAKDRIGSTSGVGATAASGLLGMVAGPLAGGALNAATKLSGYSDANAVEKVLRASGNELAANAVEAMVDENISKAGFGIKNLEPMIATGKMKAENILGQLKNPMVSNSTPDAPTSFSPKGSTPTASTAKSSGGTRVSTKDTPTATANKAAASKTAQKGAPSRASSSKAPQSKQVEHNQKTKQGFEDGGLVVKRKKC